MAEYSTDTVIIGFNFSDDTKYSNWDETSGTFTYKGADYKIGENAFQKATGKYDTDDVTFAKALNAVSKDGTILLDCWMLNVGEYGGEAATWDGTLTIGSVTNMDGKADASSQNIWISSGNLIIAPNANLGAAIMHHNGKMTVLDDAYFQVSGASTPTDLLIEDLTIIADGNPETNIGRFWGVEGTGYTLKGNCVISGEETENQQYAAMSVSKVTLLQDSTLTVENAAAVSLTNMAISEGSDVIVKDDSSLFLSTTLNIAEGSTLSLDINSKLQVAGMTTNEGKIEVDAKNQEAIFAKATDLNGFEGNGITVKNVAEGMTAVVTDEGNVFITKADMSLLKVNAEWEDLQEADPIPNMPGFYYGANALSNLHDAFGNIVPDVTKAIDILGGESSSITYDLEGKTYAGLDSVTIEKGAGLANKGNVVWGKEDDDIKLIVNSGAVLSNPNITDSLTMQANSSLIFNGAKTDDSKAYASLTGEGDVTIQGNATLDATLADLTANHLLLAGTSVAELTDSVLTAKSMTIASSLTATDSYITVSTTDAEVSGMLDLISSHLTGDALSIDTTGVITLDETSSIDITDADTLDITDAGDIDITDAGTLENTGSIALAKGATLTVAGKLENKGSIAFALNAETAIKAGSFDGTNGALTITLDGATKQYYELLTVTGADELTLNEFGAVTLSDKDYAAAIYDNDLYAISLKTILVDYNTDAVLEKGFQAGVNAYTTLEDASAAETSKGTRTYELVYNHDAMMTLNVTAVSGSTALKVYDKEKGTVLASLNVGSTGKAEFEVAKNQHVMLAFQGDTADYAFNASIVDAREQVITAGGIVGKDDEKWAPTVKEDGTTSYVFAGNGNYVGYKTAAKEIDFTVDAGQSGVFTYYIKGATTPFTYQVVNKDGKVIKSGANAQGSATFTLEQLAGDYTLIVDSYDHGEGKYNTNFDVKIEAVLNNDVTLADNAIGADASAYKQLAAGTEKTGFVGLGDKQDLIAINQAGKSGFFNIKFNVAEGANASGASINLLRLDGEKLVAVKPTPVYYRGSEIGYDGIYLDKAETYYLQITTPTQEASFRNANYTVKMALVEENNFVSAADDTLATAQEADLASAYQNWVGAEDDVDWIKLTGITAGSTGTLSFNATGNDIKADIKAVNTVSPARITDIETLNVAAGAATDSKAITFAADCDYYVRFTGKNAAAYNVSLALA